VTQSLDPDLGVGALRTLEEVYGDLYFVRNVIAWSITGGLGIVLLFTLAGVHTLMAFTVAQSQREIGIRSALGARQGRLLADIFRKGMLPVAVGAGVGWLIAAAIDIYLSSGISVYALLGAAAFMLAPGSLSLAGPARRVTRIEPTVALRDR
jgi:ABC-type antimicrobial peptide transport system permease subunit